jgi:glucosyl-3-phosphoglycerate phosphatase
MVWFVRHAQVVLNLDQPAATWRLSPAGVEAADALARRLGPVPRVVSSPEPKALATAEPLARVSGVRVELDDRLREVERTENLPTAHEHRAAVRAYLEGRAVPGWEGRAEAKARFADALETIDDTAVVTHATVLAVFLGYGFDEWSRIALPDVIEWQR